MSGADERLVAGSHVYQDMHKRRAIGHPARFSTEFYQGSIIWRLAMQHQVLRNISK